MYVTTQRLDYPDHAEEIAELNRTLADIQAMKPFPPELQPTVERLILRIDHLMVSSQPQVSIYDQREDRG